MNVKLHLRKTPRHRQNTRSPRSCTSSELGATSVCSAAASASATHSLSTLCSSAFTSKAHFGPVVHRATGTLGVAGRAPRRENRGTVGGEGWGLRGRAPPRKFMNFSSQNGVKWCVLGVLFLRLMCPMDCSCMIHFIEVPVCA